MSPYGWFGLGLVVITLVGLAFHLGRHVPCRVCHPEKS